MEPQAIKAQTETTNFCSDLHPMASVDSLVEMEDPLALVAMEETEAMSLL